MTKMSASPSHVLMRMSERSRRLSARWNERQTPAMFTGSPAPPDGGGDTRRHALQDGLQGEAHRALFFGERVADDGEDRRARHAVPGHRQAESDEGPRPRGADEVDRVAGRGDGDEDQ